MRNEFVTDTQEAEPLTMAALLDRPNADRQKADGMAQKPECVEDKAAALFPAQETENFRQRWSSIQGKLRGYAPRGGPAGRRTGGDYRSTARRDLLGRAR